MDATTDDNNMNDDNEAKNKIADRVKTDTCGMMISNISVLLSRRVAGDPDIEVGATEVNYNTELVGKSVSDEQKYLYYIRSVILNASVNYKIMEFYQSLIVHKSLRTRHDDNCNESYMDTSNKNDWRDANYITSYFIYKIRVRRTKTPGGNKISTR